MTHLMTVVEVAERVGLKHQAVRRAIKRGELEATKLCGRVRIEPAAVDAWIQRGRTRRGVARATASVKPLMKQQSNRLRDVLKEA